MKERKMTLPLIHELQTKSTFERRKTIRAIKRSADQPEVAAKLLEDIQNGPGIAYAEKAMLEHRDRAVSLLEALPESESRSALIDLVDFTISRKK